MLSFYSFLGSMVFFFAIAANAAEVKALDCSDLEKFYPKLERTYKKKAPLLKKAGWGDLKDWGSDDFDAFRDSVLRCREQGFFKKTELEFLRADLDKKVQEMRDESARLKDDVKIVKTLAEYKQRVNELAKNLDEAKASELKNMKDLIQRITGIDDSVHFNEASALQNRIDTILKSPRKKLPAKENMSLEKAADQRELDAREADPVRFKKCEALNVQYQGLMQESLELEKKTLAEKEVEGMQALAKEKDALLHRMESVSLQLRDVGCKVFFTPQTSVQ